MTLEMSRKKQRETEFGDRLVAARKARRLTQLQLAEAVDTTQRAISSYETQASYPPAPVIADLARALRVTTDELLGLKKPAKILREAPTRETQRLWKKFQQIQTLPEKDQRAVIRLVNSLVAAQGNGHGRRR